MDASSFNAQKRGWALLRELHPSAIDLRRIAALRECDSERLTSQVETLICELGLNDEGLNELPPELHAFCGGLRIWQYPAQFGKYLVHLSRLNIRSYMEIGIRHGGSFVATTEYLQRFHRLDFAVGVDVIDCPSMAEYQRLNPAAQFWKLNSRGAEFAARLDEIGRIDLVFIDSHHEEDQLREELALFASRANFIALHDIANIGCPGVGRVWQEMKRSPQWDYFEYTDQYGLGPFMGIGLAARRGR